MVLKDMNKHTRFIKSAAVFGNNENPGRKMGWRYAINEEIALKCQPSLLKKTRNFTRF
jgi:hypothetical protein